MVTLDEMLTFGEMLGSYKGLTDRQKQASLSEVVHRGEITMADMMSLMDAQIQELVSGNPRARKSSLYHLYHIAMKRKVNMLRKHLQIPSDITGVDLQERLISALPSMEEETQFVIIEYLYYLTMR